MTVSQLVSDLQGDRLVAIIRLTNHGPVVDVAETLVAAGVRFLEVTIERPSGVDALRRVVQACGARAVVGAGTVTRSEDVARVADAGASFIVTPNVDPRVIAAAIERELVILPGAFTPSEVALAAACGAHFVKLFPASTGGVAHLRALRGPFPHVRFVPTGGVRTENAREWFDAGATAIAMGSNLVPSDGALHGLEERTRRAVQASARILNAPNGDRC